jgi:hypothetical protein
MVTFAKLIKIILFNEKNIFISSFSWWFSFRTIKKVVASDVTGGDTK